MGMLWLGDSEMLGLCNVYMHLEIRGRDTQQPAGALAFCEDSPIPTMMATRVTLEGLKI